RRIVARRRVSAERLRPRGHGRQRLELVQRLLRRREPRDREGARRLLRSRRAGEVGVRAAGARGRARDQGRLVPVQPVLLRELPSFGAPRHALRHRFGAHRIPLRPGRVGEAVRSTNVNAKRILRGLLLSASLGALAACTSIDVKTTPYPGVAKYAATDPEKVEILRSTPSRAHDKLGEIQLDASNDPAPPLVDLGSTLREEAAKLGADAVVVMQYREMVVPDPKAGNPPPPNAPTITIHRAIAVAIKYK